MIANIDVLLDIKINVVDPAVNPVSPPLDPPLPDTPAGILPATRDGLASFFNSQLDFFGLALPAYGVILALLCLLAFVVFKRVKTVGGRHRERGRTLTNTIHIIPLVLLLAVSLGLPNLNSADAEDIEHTGLTVTTDPQNIVWNVPQGTATTETFTGTTTVFSDANRGYELFVTGDITGMNSPTHDIGFSIAGGDLTATTPLSDEQVLIKSHSMPIADDATTFDFIVDIPRTLAIGEYTVSLNFSLEAPDFPSIESIDPLVGPEAGGTDITIVGVNLISSEPTVPGNEPNIEVGSQPCDIVNVTVEQPYPDPPLISPSPTYVVCKTRAHVSGDPWQVDLKVTNPDSGVVDVPRQFTYLAAPTITSVSPQRVAAGHAPRLTITGTNFDVASGLDGNEITLSGPSGNITCQGVPPMSPDGTQIICDAPALTAASYTASVATTGGTAVSSGASGTIVVQNAPVVTSLSTVAGVLAGTNTITVNGYNFTTDGTTSVTIGGKTCTSLSVASSTQLSCNVPPGDGPAPATVDVLVTVAYPAAGGGNVTSANTADDNYTYLSSPTIDPGPGGGDISVDAPSNLSVPTGMNGSRPPVVDLAGNYYGQPAVITINGSGFDATSNTTAVTVGGQPCTVLSVAITTLTCNPPAQSAAGNYPIVVSTNGGSYPTGSQTVNLAYLDKPTITAVSPNPVPTTTATILTVNGSNFDSISSAATANKIEIGAGVCSLISIISPSELTCRTPSNIVAGNPSQAMRITTLAGTYLADGTNSAGNGGDGISPREQVEVTFMASPAISAISPVTGPVAGGTLITVTASDICFNNASIIDGATVTKGANAISVFNSTATPASVNCTTNTGPSGGTFEITTPNVTSSGAGLADIAVSTTVGDSNNTASDDFVYMSTPTITSFSPLATDVLGKALYTDPTNATLTINGSNFDNIGANLIYINNELCSSSGADTTSQLQCTVPASTIVAGGAGTNLEVKVVTHGDTVTKGGTDGFTYLAAPTISGVSPAPVPASTATTIYIAGTNFDNITGGGSTTVKIGSGTCLNVTVTSTSTLSCTTPDNITTGGKQSITIETLAGKYEADGNSGRADVEVVFQNAPAISAISPVSGSVAGGTKVTVTASNICLNNASIIDDVTVTKGAIVTSVFNNNVTASVSCTSSAGPADGTFEIYTPDVTSDGSGTADISVSTTVGSSTNTAADDFAYMNTAGISDFSPTAATVSGKARYTDSANGVLTINGYDFDHIGANLIYINDVPCPSTGTDTTDQLQCTIPAGTGTDLEVKVVTHGDTVTKGGTGNSDGFSYLVAPTVTSITPVRGQANVSRQVTVAGSNFDNITGDGSTTTSTTVKIGAGVCDNVNVIDAGSLTCDTPIMTAGGPLDITVTTLGGTNTLLGSAGGYTFQDAPNSTGVSPVAGNKAGGFSLSISGSNLSSFDPDPPSSDTVTIGGVPCTSASYESSTNTIDCTVPALPDGQTPGARTVAINTLAGNHSLIGAFTYLDDPGLYQVISRQTLGNGMNMLAIQGENFDDLNIPTSTQIFFNGIEQNMVTTVPNDGECRVISATVVNCVISPFWGTTYITTSTAGVDAYGSLAYNYVDTGGGALNILPNYGGAGTFIEITGNLGLPNLPAEDYIHFLSVTLGFSVCEVASAYSGTYNNGYGGGGLDQITCTTTSGQPGWQTIWIDIPGSVTFHEIEAFYYLDSPTINNTTNKPSPNHGVVNGEVTIWGSNFDPDVIGAGGSYSGTGSTVFRFDGEIANCTVDSPSHAVCKVPNRPGGATYIDGTPTPVNITVTTDFGTTATATAVFDYMPRPVVNSVAPSTGSLAAASKTFTINGTGFDRTYGSTLVTVGGKACAIASIANDGKSLSCTLGSGEDDFTTGVQAVEVTTAGGADSQNLYTAQAVPTVSSVTNKYGAIGTAANNIVIAGDGFTNVSQVWFGSQAASSFEINSTNQITAIAPIQGATTDTTSLTVDVTVTTPGGTSPVHDTNTKFDYMARPTITDVKNNESGSAAFGEAYGPSTAHAIKITGTGFRTTTHTNFASLVSSVKVDTASGNSVCSDINVNADGTEITCNAPGLAAGKKDVVVNSVITSQNSGTDGQEAYEYIGLPTVTEVSPNSGPRAGGTTKDITLSGANYVDVTDVLFNGTSVGASNFTVNTGSNPVTISVQAPASVATTFPTLVNVQVVAVGGTSADNGTLNNYTYHAVPVVTMLDKKYAAAGAQAEFPTSRQGIKITGSGFTGATVVEFGTGNTATITSRNGDTELTVTAPAQSAGTVDVTVTTPGGTSVVHTTNSKFEYMAAPTITKVENGATGKTYGPTTAHTIKITGTNFKTSSATSNTTVIDNVKIGGTAANLTCGSLSVASATELTCTPSTASSSAGQDKDVQITSFTTQNSASSANSKYSFIGLPTVTQVSPNLGPKTGGSTQNITLSGANYIDVTDVKFGSTSVGAGNFTVDTTSNPVTISVKAPASAATTFPATVNVQVVAVGGQSVDNVNADDYTYLAEPTLTAGGISPSPTNAASKTVTLAGSGFLTDNTRVQVQGTDGNITATVTGTAELTFSMPVKSVTAATNFTVTVTTPGGVSNALNYEVLPAPTVSEVLPNIGSQAGNTTVTVSGTNFCRVNGTSAISNIYVGTVEGTLVPDSISCSTSTNSIQFITPAKPSPTISKYDITVTTAGGTSDTSTADEFSYTGPPEISSVKQTIAGTTATYVKATDTVYVYANYLCENGDPVELVAGAVTAAGSSTAPVPITTIGTPVCASDTSGYVSVALPSVSDRSMTAPYDISLTNAEGTSAPVAADQVIYPPTPTVSKLENIVDGVTYEGYVLGTSDSTGVTLEGANFKTADAGVDLVKSITIYDADGISNPVSVTVYTQPTPSAGSITGITIPPLSAGAHVIKVETNGGTGSCNFYALGTITISSPTTAYPALLWSSPAITNGLGSDESFTINGSSFAPGFTTIKIAGVNPAAGSCTYGSFYTYTACKIDRDNAATLAEAGESYTLVAESVLAGTATNTNAIRIDQVSPTNYIFAGTADGATVFACSDLIEYVGDNPVGTNYHTAIVRDIRDNTNNRYRVRKLADGNCWMIDNLYIAGKTLTSELSDIAAGATWSLASPTNQGGTMPSTQQVREPPYSTKILHELNAGRLYNGAAAHLGQSTTTNDAPATSSPCPANWKLPTEGEYTALNIAYGGNYATLWARGTGAFSYFPAGYYQSAGNIPGGGTIGRFITSKVGLTFWGVNTTAATGIGDPANQGRASSIRCVKRDPSI